MIRKGEAWGVPRPIESADPVATSDREVVAFIRECLDHNTPPPIVVLRGGDLYRSLGGSPSPEPFRLPIDLLEVTADGERHLAVAHVVAHRRWWHGDCAVAMNASHYRGWNLGPKAHPNDGRVDVTTGALGLRDRLAARRRAPSGTHIPHPELHTSRPEAASWRFEHPTPAWVDGVPIGPVREVDIVVLADAAAVTL